MNPRPLIAEFVGTLLLTLAVILSPVIAKFGVPVAWSAGLVLALTVYAVGSVSGAHINPAVTVALASIKKMSVQDAFQYVLAQLLGALAAMALAAYVGGQELTVTTQNTAAVTIMEAIGAFVLLWGIMAVVHGKVHQAASGLVIGGSLSLGVLVSSGLGSNGILNPAVALALHSFTLSNVVGPIVGAIAAVWLYDWIVTKPVHHAPSHA